MEQEGCSVSFNPWPPLSSGRFHGLIRGDLKNLVFLSVSRSFSRKIHEPKDLRMRHFLSLALAALIALFSPSMVSAADAAHGEQIFSANCAACHIGGGNVVNGQRTLQQDDLKAYLANYNEGHQKAIAYQVTNGKNGMPAFGAKLGADDIADVAAYVESQSINGWS